MLQKFLIHHNISILSKPQSLGSFIQYLYHNNFTQPFKISINTIYNETHIYINNNDLLLPNHIQLQTNNLPKYYHLPIRSTPNNISNSNNFTNDHSIEIEYTLLPIKIASININGLLQPNKKLTITEALNNNTYDILGISETHLSTKERKILNNQINNYQSFWSTFSHIY